jgi:hypothetical protein
MVVHDAETGQPRSMRIDDLWNMAAPIELGEQVPAPIREQFDIARNAFVYRVGLAPTGKRRPCHGARQ